MKAHGPTRRMHIFVATIVLGVLGWGLPHITARAEAPEDAPQTAERSTDSTGDIHWAFQKPVRPALPQVERADWPRNPIDHFILARLEAEGLSPSPPADRTTLIRRVSLDLTGLPPTLEQVEAFVNDQRPDAYERLVDRLLASPAYGERWARVWLDLARYADTKGYEKDSQRTIWRYRDWVIHAYNDDMPFDRFTIEQIAGDLLPDPTLSQLIATAFHRNTMTNTEGGTSDEEFRVAAVKDRADTTAQVWMGITMGCAKCHTHKYDPITHHEYYQFYAFFNQTQDNDQPNESPTMPAPTAAMRERIGQIDAKIADVKKQLATPTPERAQAQEKWESTLSPAQPDGGWTPLDPTAMQSESGASMQKLGDGSILVSGDRPANDTYTITAQTDLSGIVAFRLEALPHESLPAGGSGRADDGNFVLSNFSVTAEKPGAAEQPLTGRYIRIELPGEQKMLSLAEVQVLSGGQNIAPAGKASQSTTDYGGAPQRAIDNNTDGHYANADSTTHTSSQTDPWWELDLGSEQPIDGITIWNRTDGDLGHRLAGARVTLLDASRETVWQQTMADAPDPSRALALSGRQPVTLDRAIADFSQNDYPVDESLQQKDITQGGWALSPRQAQPHHAIFLPAAPVGDGPATLLTFRLDHRFKQPHFTLGHFRISATTDPAAARRAPVPADILAVIDTPADQRTQAQSAKLAEHYRSIAPSLQPLRDRIAALEKSKPTAPTIPVMRRLPEDQRRESHVMLRGNYLSLGDKVTPGVPEAFHPMPESAPMNRLGLAKWLIDEDNPLTARVAVNRYWAQIFGIGIVETAEDFGTQGLPPSHPKLLDWLATEFMRLDWSRKQLAKLIVMSATYRQSSHVTPELYEIDPRNRLLARGPRFRLPAEMIRDQALTISGLLSREMLGPSVMPPQPDGVWQVVYSGDKWITSEGSDRYRRGLYTFWRRTSPYPSMTTFDATSREICTIRRIRTNTPLQALVTLNDPVYVEAAEALARRMMTQTGQTPAQRAAYGFRLATAREPSPKEVDRIVALYQTEVEHYRNHRSAATRMATEILGPPAADLDIPQLAAWTVVANVLLNLDEVLMKG